MVPVVERDARGAEGVWEVKVGGGGCCSTMIARR